jgi:molybdopterin synthase sulfur carrier subunit
MKIIYFAWLKDAVGCEEEEIALPAGVSSVSQLIDWLAGRGPQYEAAFEFVEVVKVVVNKVLVRNDHLVKDDDEVIFVPPIAGG